MAPAIKSAVRLIVLPSQTGLLLVAFGGAGPLFTVTVTEAVFVHPAALVPVMVYVVVALGFAVTVAPEVVLKPEGGDQA